MIYSHENINDGADATPRRFSTKIIHAILLRQLNFQNIRVFSVGYEYDILIPFWVNLLCNKLLKEKVQ